MESGSNQFSTSLSAKNKNYSGVSFMKEEGITQFLARNKFMRILRVLEDKP